MSGSPWAATNPALGLAHLSNFGFLRNQTPYTTTPWTPVANDFDIENDYADSKIENITFWNATNGIRVSQPQTGYGAA